MPDYMRHERLRWDTMTDAQLMTRLNKITIRDKVDCFIRVAAEYNREELKQAGLHRWNSLFVGRHPMEVRERDRLRENIFDSMHPLRPVQKKPKKPKIIYEPEFRMIR